MKVTKKILSLLLCVLFIFGAAPLSGIKGLGSFLKNGLSSVIVSAKEEIKDIIEHSAPENVSDNTLVATGQCGDNVYWSFNEATGVLTISGTGDMEGYSSFDSPFYNSSSIIKSVIIQNGVTSIGDGVFFYCKSLTSVEIPNSVTSIGSSAFYGCSSLTSIEIPDSVTSIGSSAFYNCSALTSVTIGNSVTSIGSGAFRKCTSLTSIVIPDSVTSIDDDAFNDCISLISFEVDENNKYYSSDECGVLYNKDKTELIKYPIGNTRTSFSIPDSVTSIGNYAFYKCGSLTSIEIPDSVTSIGSSTFYGCTGLTSIEIPDSVTSIGNFAFYECTSLTSIVIPDSVTSIGGMAFYNCIGLTGVYISDIDAWAQIDFLNYSTIRSNTCNPIVYAKYLYLNNKLVTDVVLSDDVTKISDYAFCNCYSLTSIEIPDSVTNIGNYAFRGCTNLVDLTIGNSVTSIGSYTFYGCTGLTSIEIPDSVTSIGNYAFYNCSALTSVTIGNSVTSIGGMAFYKCSSLTSIEIPDSVTSIGYDAFSNCSALTSVTIGNSVTSIGSSAFYGCSSLTSIEIPDSVTSIGYDAFSNCSALTSVTIGNSVTSIGSSAFYGCSSLTSIEIPDSVTSIGYDAFSNCSALTSVTIGNSVTSICNYAFRNCTSLTSVLIGNGVTSIGNYAFEDCSSLTSIEIPNGVTSIGSGAFRKCTSLTSIAIPFVGATKNGTEKTHFGYIFGASSYSDNNSYVPSSLKSVVITGGESIDNDAFYKCTGITSVEILDSVTSIGNYAFDVCIGLTGVYISSVDAWSQIDLANGYSNPLRYAKNLYLNNELVTNVVLSDNVTKISDYAFYYCSSLTSIVIPDSVTSIGNYAFYYCSSLTSIAIPDSVTSIGNYAFDGCIGLTGVYISSVDAWTQIDFDNSSSNPLCYAKNLYLNNELVTNVVLSDDVKCISNHAFRNCISLTSIEIPDSVISIGHYAFSGCSSITSIEIPNSVTSIGSYAFYVCTRLTCVEIPDSVISIGSYAFYKCSGLTSVTIGNSVTSIGSDAFYGCTRLTIVEIPDSVTSIGKYAFYGCSGLNSVTIGKSVTYIGESAFRGCTALTDVYFSDVNKWAQINFENWYSNPMCNASNLYLGGKQIKDVVLSNTVKEISNYAFERCTSLTSIVIPKGVTSIGHDAFSGCTGLKSANLPNGLITIGFYAFEGCQKLIIINIPNSVIDIGHSAFYNCNSLTSVSIPNGVTSIGYNAFYSCSSLTSVEIPDSVTNIGSNAFYNCSSLTTVTIPDATISIGDSVFCNCTNLRSVYIGDGVENIGYSIFSGCTSLTSITVPFIPPDTRIIGEKRTELYSFFGSNVEAIPQSLKSVVVNGGDLIGGTFRNCENISSVTIGVGVTDIGDNTFYSCSSLKSVSISESVISIGNCAFGYCSSLTNVEIPKSVMSIGQSAFSNCTEIKRITLPESLTSIGSCAFYNCTSLSNISLPDSLRNIGSAAFENTAYYNSNVNWTNGVLYIGKHLIEATGSTNSSYSIISGTKSIAGGAFSSCGNFLKSISIPESVQGIGVNAFKNTYLYNNINNWTNGVLYIGNYLIKADSSISSLYEVKSGTKCIAGGAFDAITNLKEIYLPNSLTFIGDKAFVNCEGLSSIIITNNVGYIGNEAFQDCIKLSNIQLGDNVKFIGEAAFYRCKKIENITIPNNVAFIGDYAFCDCNKIKSITIPYSVKLVGYYCVGFYHTTSFLGENDPFVISCYKNSAAEVYAKVNKLNYVLKIKIIYNTSGGNLDIKFEEKCIGDAFGEIPIPTKQECYFGGWYDSAHYGNIYNEDTILTYSANEMILYARWIKDISIEKKPDKMKYYAGDTVNTDGLELKVYYENGDIETITDDFSIENDMLENPGNQKITVNYYGAKVEYIVLVQPVETKSLEITNPPDKVQYFVGEKLSLEGLKLSLEYNNGKVDEITDGYKVSTVDMSTPGTKTVTVSYNGYKAYFDIEVSEVLPTSVRIVNMPDKTDYYEGDKLNTDGLSLEVTYNNGAKEVVDSGFDCSPTALKKEGNQTVTVNFDGVSSSFDVSVSKVLPEQLNVVSLPSQQKYFKGEDLNTKGMKLSVTYNSGKEKSIDTFDKIESNYDFSDSGEKAVSLTYSENGVSVTNSFNVLVSDIPEIYSDSNITANAGEYVNIPVYISGNCGLSSFKISLSYDKSVLTPESVTSAAALNNGSSINLLESNVDNNPNGKLDVLWASADNSTSDGTLFTVRFKVNKKAEGSQCIKLSFDRQNTSDENGNLISLKCRDIDVLVDNSNVSSEPLIYIDSAEAKQGESLSVPVRASNLERISNTVIQLKFDTSAFNLVNVSHAAASVVFSNPMPDGLMIVIQTDNKIDDDILFTLNFTVSNTASGNYSIEFANSGGFETSSAGINVIAPIAHIFGEKAVINSETNNVSIPILLEDNPGLMGYGLRISYDTSVLEFVGANRDELWNKGYFEYKDEGGKINMAWFASENVTLNGALFNLDFRIKDTESFSITSIQISYDVENTFNENFEDVRIDCSPITVMSFAETTLKLKDGSSACIDDENKIVYGLSDTPYCEDDILNNLEVIGIGVTSEIVPTENGFGTGTIINLLVNDEIVDSYTVIIFGDATGDGIIDESDFVMIDLYNAMLYFPEEDSPEFLGMDCNRDGVVDESDIVLVDLTNAFMGEIDQVNGGIIFY